MTYREPADTPDEPETTLVHCWLEARPGVPFGLTLTDGRVTYLRRVSLRWSPTETVTSDVRRARDVTLRTRGHWLLRGLGALLVGVVALQAGAYLAGVVPTLRVLKLLLLAAAAVTCFVGARRRLTLAWRDGGRRHEIAVPATYNAAARDAMATALHETARLLADPTARRAAADQARDRPAADVQTDDGARRPCLDDTCTGILGADDRCGMCGRVARSDG